MQKATFVLALLAFVLAVAAWLRPYPPRGVSAAQQPTAVSDSVGVPLQSTTLPESTYPPLILVSRSWLECSTASTKEGRLTIHTIDGQGFHFSTPILPVKDAKVSMQGASLSTEFDAYPVTAVFTCLKGIGDGTITTMKIEVWFQLSRYQYLSQTKSLTNIGFKFSDSASNPPYIELTGVFERQRDSKKFPFRVIFGKAVTGSGNVTSAAPDRMDDLSLKLHFGTSSTPLTAMTSLYEIEDDVRSLPSTRIVNP